MKNTGLYLQWDANQGVLPHHSALLVTKQCCWHFCSQHSFRVDGISLLYCILVSEARTTLGLIHCCACSERRGLWRQLGKSGHILHVVANGGSFGHNLLHWCRGGCWPAQVVDHTLLPWVHLLCSSCLGQGICFPPLVAGQKLKGWVDKTLLDGWECTFWATSELESIHELTDVMKFSWYLPHHYLAGANMTKGRSVLMGFFLISGSTMDSPIICPHGQYTWSLHWVPCHQSD